MKTVLMLIISVTYVAFAHARQNDVAAEINKLEQPCVQAIPKQDTATLKKLWALHTNLAKAKWQLDMYRTTGK